MNVKWLQVRLESEQPLTGYDDDSVISEIDLKSTNGAADDSEGSLSFKGGQEDDDDFGSSDTPFVGDNQKLSSARGMGIDDLFNIAPQSPLELFFDGLSSLIQQSHDPKHWFHNQQLSGMDASENQTAAPDATITVPDDNPSIAMITAGLQVLLRQVSPQVKLCRSSSWKTGLTSHDLMGRRGVPLGSAAW